MRPLAAIVVLGSALAACSDIYYDRRETIAFGADDAVASNSAAQVINPWPRSAENRDHSTDGAVMVSAVERYRTGRVIPPRGTGTSSSGYGQQQNALGPGAQVPQAIQVK